jgi:hypothetical protein
MRTCPGSVAAPGFGSLAAAAVRSGALAAGAVVSGGGAAAKPQLKISAMPLLTRARCRHRGIDEFIAFALRYAPPSVAFMYQWCGGAKRHAAIVTMAYSIDRY